MRARAYRFVIKTRLLEGLTYRFDLIGGLATRIVLMVTAVYLWRAAFQGRGETAGVGEADMVHYVVLSTAVSPLLVHGVQNRVYDRVRTGDISLDLLRPARLPALWLAEDVGESLSAGAMQAAPLLVAAALLFGPPVPATFGAALLFLLSLTLSFGILWLLSALCGLVALWAAEIGNLGYVKDAVIRIASGSLVPLWFFPEWAQAVSRFLPFQYTYQTPLAIFIGRDLAPPEVATALLTQSAWILVLSGVFLFTWSRGRRRLLVQGG